MTCTNESNRHTEIEKRTTHNYRWNLADLPRNELLCCDTSWPTAQPTPARGSVRTDCISTALGDEQPKKKMSEKREMTTFGSVEAMPEVTNQGFTAGALTTNSRDAQAVTIVMPVDGGDFDNKAYSSDDDGKVGIIYGAAFHVCSS